MKNSRMTRRKLLQQGAAVTAAIGANPMPYQKSNAPTESGAEDLLATLKAGHPRLHATAQTWDVIKARRGGDALLDAFLKRGETEARALIDTAPMAYNKRGKRLLHVSRTVLRRVLLLALHFHLADDATLARRAKDEMLAAAAFTDWNPSHFLDVGEMTMALAIGYDWLYGQLDASARKTIVGAIVEKGLKPGLANDSFARSTNNWNSVCLSGLSLGALAIGDLEPALARQILEMTRANNINGLRPYAPDGVYPEGAMYWGYGTTFQVVLLDTLKTALGTDWGLAASPGFIKSGEAMNQQLGPSGQFFNFSDNVERPGMEPAMWWYARTLRAPELLRYEHEMLKRYIGAEKPEPLSESNRLMPLAALWWVGEPARKSDKSLPPSWLGQGPNPIATFRSGWDDPRAMYVALKAGGAPISHAHMDAGSFIFEANGVRWACDLGMQDYLSLESKGINLWNGAQTGRRWQVYRLGPFSHSVLTINEQLHRADGRAVLTHFSDSGDTGAVIDLSPVFATQATRAARGFAFRPDSHLLIRDEIEGLKAGDRVRWAMLTRADAAVSEDGLSVILSQSGEQLRVSLISSNGAKWEVIPADPPKNDYDAPNPGARLLIMTLAATVSGTLDFSVILEPGRPSRPGRAAFDKLAGISPSQWPIPRVG